MDKIKVIHIIPDFGTGGAEKLVLDLLSNFDNRHFDISVISLYEKKDSIYEIELEKKGIKVCYLGKKPGLDPSMFVKLYNIFKKYKPQVIHTHRYVVRYTLLPSVLLKIPVKVHTVHNIARKELDYYGRIIQSISYHFFGYVPVAISNTIKRTIKEEYKIRRDIPTVVNGIDTKEYFTAEKSTKAIKIIHIGRFTEQKNHNLLLKSFSILCQKRDNLKLVLVGDGELKSEILNQIKILNLEEKVDLLGLRGDIPNLLSISNIFIMTSKWEGLPLTILEAMASSLPIVASNVGGISDVLEHNKNGFLINDSNPTSYVNSLTQLIDNISLREEMGRHSYFISKKFDITETQREYEKLYRRLLGRK